MDGAARLRRRAGRERLRRDGLIMTIFIDSTSRVIVRE